MRKQERFCPRLRVRLQVGQCEQRQECICGEDEKRVWAWKGWRVCATSYCNVMLWTSFALCAGNGARAFGPSWAAEGDGGVAHVQPPYRLHRVLCRVQWYVRKHRVDAAVSRVSRLRGQGGVVKGWGAVCCDILHGTAHRGYNHWCTSWDMLYRSWSADATAYLIHTAM